MFRAQLSITVVVVVLVTAIVAYQTHQSAAREALRADTDRVLRAAASIIELERRLEESAMAAKARYFVAQDEDLPEIILADYTEKAAENNTDPTHERHLAVHERLLRFEYKIKQYRAQGEGKGMRDVDVPLAYRAPIKPDLLFVVDSKGIGVAALGKDLYSWYDEDVSTSLPLLLDVLKNGDVETDIFRFKFTSKDVKEDVEETSLPLFVGAIAPIRSGPDIVGAVVFGSRFSDGSAQRNREHIAGVDALVEGDGARDELVAQAPHVAYFHDGVMFASSFDTDTEQKINKALFEDTKLLELEGDEKVTTLSNIDGLEGQTYFVRARLLPGHRFDDTPTGLIVLADWTLAQQPMASPGRLTMLTMLIMLILGISLVLIFIQLFIKPIADVEQGIQEVLAGNRDYEFVPSASNQVARGLAQQLNNMSAFLQGKPMPDDEDGAGGAWSDMGVGPKSSAPTSSGPSRVQGVSMQDLMGQRPNQDADS